MFHLYHYFCSRCYGNNKSSCSSCIDRWRPWRYPCYAAAAGLVVGWVSIAPCHVRSHPQPPPLWLCLRNPWAWLHKMQAANHASPLVSHTCSYVSVIGIHIILSMIFQIGRCLEVKTITYNCNITALNLPADLCCTISLPNFQSCFYYSCLTKAQNV